MRFPIAILLTGLVSLSLLVTTAGQQATTKDNNPHDLVKQLGSRKFTERDAAAVALELLGTRALPALEQVLKTGDLEVRRARKDPGQDSPPGRVRTTARQQAHAASSIKTGLFSKPSKTWLPGQGFPIQFSGDRAAVADRTLTLDTGETTFWKAFTLFCTKAGLVERTQPEIPGGRIVLEDGRAKPIPTWFAGKLRLQALAAPWPYQKGETGFLLTVTPEPHMPWRAIERLTILQAIDDRGQTLKQPQAYFLEESRLFGDPKEVGRWDAGTANVAWGQTVEMRTLLVRLLGGKQPATRLVEVRGVLTVGLATPRPVVTVEEVAKAVGKPVKTASGGTLLVTQFKQEGQDLRLRVRLDGFPVTGRDGKVIQVVRKKPGFVAVTGSPGGEQPHITLQDAQGKILSAVTVSSEVSPNPGGGLIRETTLLYRNEAGPAAPLRLVYSAPTPILVDVPFTLRDVPLVAARSKKWLLLLRLEPIAKLLEAQFGFSQFGQGHLAPGDLQSHFGFAQGNRILALLPLRITAV